MNRREWRAALLATAPLLVFALLIGSCGGKDNPTAPTDTTAPSATTLAVGTITTTTVQLTWVAPGDDGSTGTANRYDIRYSTATITAANYASATPVAVTPTPGVAGTAQLWTVSGLTPNTPYYFAMKSADEIPNWSGMSNVLQATTHAVATDTTAPAATTLAVGTITTTTVQLTWVAPGDDGSTGTAHSYDIRYSISAITAANFASATPVAVAPTPGVAGTAQQWTVSGLTPNTPYYFAMKSADEIPNWSGLSNVVQATTAAVPGDTTPPATTANLATGTVTSSSVQLTWAAPGDDGVTGTAAQYEIRYSTSAINAGNFASATLVSGSPAPAAAGTSQSVTVTGLTPSTPYHFAMRTADEVPNWSGLSNVAQATTTAAADVTPPAAVTSLAAGTVTSTSVPLTWTATGDDSTTGTAAQYEIRYSTSAITAGNFASATLVSGAPAPVAAGTSQSVMVTGLTPQTPYYFAMRTADEVPNWSGLSNVAQATTAPPTDATPPAAVTDLEANAIDSTAVALAWTAPGDDESQGTSHQYDVRYATVTITEANWATATQASDEPTPGAAGALQSLRVDGLQPGYDYFFAMKTSDEVPNTSALSNVATVHMPTGPTAPPMISSLVLPDSVCISSTDPWAQAAAGLAMGQLAMAQGFANMGGAFFAPLNSADWQQTGDCWDYSWDAGGCSATYHVCRTGSDYEYTLTYNGTCMGQNDNWVAYRANFNYDTHTGTFYMYEPNTTTVAVAWVWTEAADALSGSYTFYEGDPSGGTVQVSIEWTRTADGNTTTVTFTTPEALKWESSFTRTPCSGTLKIYQWRDFGSLWWQQTDIAWFSDGTGFYSTYDESGAVIDSHTW